MVLKVEAIPGVPKTVWMISRGEINTEPKAILKSKANAKIAALMRKGRLRNNDVFKNRNEDVFSRL
jgi:hypothetical protein